MTMLGEVVVIAKGNKLLLRRVPIETDITIRKPGTAKGQILYIAPDFSEMPTEFKECV